MSIVAHRGDFILENTLHGFENAWKNNIKIVECDIRLSKDNIIVISHDNKIVIKNSKTIIKINETYYEKIKDIILNNGYNIPTLEELFKLAKQMEDDNVVNYCPKIIIEMKTNRKEIGQYLANFLNNNVQYIKYIELIMSFNICSLYSCKTNLNNNLQLFLLLDDFLKIINSIIDVPFSTIIEKKYKSIDGYYIKYNPMMLDNQLINNKLINIMESFSIGVWGTDLINSDNKETINRLLEIGIKYVNTNDIKIFN